MIYRIGFFYLLCASLFGVEHVYLKTPNITQEHFIGADAGIRPYRKSGIRLESEYIQDKLIIHNYGYGGSGLTLAFGGAKEVLDNLNKQKAPSKTVAILGAGIAGLTTAYDLLENGYQVHIYADQWSPNTTSDIAGGIWTPLSATPETENLHDRMLEVSEQRLLQSTGTYPEFTGVKLMCYYSLTPDGQDPAQNALRGKEVIVHFDNGVIKKGRKRVLLGIDGKLFLEDLYAKVKSKGAEFHQRHFSNVEDILLLEEPVIINCMSMGSRAVFNDQDFIPSRGQLVYFAAQEGIDYLLSKAVPDSKYHIFIHPWNDRLIVGGVSEPGKEDPHIDLETVNTIIHNAQECLRPDEHNLQHLTPGLQVVNSD